MGWIVSQFIDSALKGLLTYVVSVILLGSAAVSSRPWISFLWIWPAATAVHFGGAVALRRSVERHPDLRFVDVATGPGHPSPSPRTREEVQIALFRTGTLEVDSRFVPGDSRQGQTRLIQGGRIVGQFPVGPVGTRWADLFRHEGIKGQVAGKAVRLFQTRPRGLRRKSRVLQIQFGDVSYSARVHGFPGVVTTSRADGTILSIEAPSGFAVDRTKTDEVLLAFALFAVGARIAAESPLWRFSI